MNILLQKTGKITFLKFVYDFPHFPGRTIGVVFTKFLIFYSFKKIFFDRLYSCIRLKQLTNRVLFSSQQPAAFINETSCFSQFISKAVSNLLKHDIGFWAAILIQLVSANITPTCHLYFRYITNTGFTTLRISGKGVPLGSHHR